MGNYFELDIQWKNPNCNLGFALSSLSVSFLLSRGPVGQVASLRGTVAGVELAIGCAIYRRAECAILADDLLSVLHAGNFFSMD